eukprot:scaffold96176_cov61-Cyclotella_meneghiniana.AAC.2
MSQRSVNPTNNYCATLKTTNSNGKTAATSPSSSSSSSSLGGIFTAASVESALVESSIFGRSRKEECRVYGRYLQCGRYHISRVVP